MKTELIKYLAFEYLVPRQIRYIKPVRRGHATGLVADVYQQMAREFQVVPPLTVHSLIPELLAAVWAAARETLVAGPADRVARETVAVTVSRLNSCPYCVDVHCMMLDVAGRSDVVNASLATDSTLDCNSETARLLQWASASMTPNAPILSEPPFSALHAPQLIGTTVLFHYFNRVVSTLFKASPFPFPTNRFLRRMAGSLVGDAIPQPRVPPGDSLKLLPEVPLPHDLRWAAPNRAVAGAFARLAHVTDRAGTKALAPAIREGVRARLQAWHGEAVGLDQAWLAKAMAELPADHHSAGRLAMMVAFASHLADDAVVRDFLSDGANNEQLLSVVSWASFEAARRIGTWLGRSPIHVTQVPDIV